MTVDAEQKKARISLIRSDVKTEIDKHGLPPGPPFDGTQTVVMGAVFDYLIDCIAELELKVERLEAVGGERTTVVRREVVSASSDDHSGGWDTPVMGRFRD